MFYRAIFCHGRKILFIVYRHDDKNSLACVYKLISMSAKWSKKERERETEVAALQTQTMDIIYVRSHARASKQMIVNYISLASFDMVISLINEGLY